jgi:glycosyltransferase involved in cell wall biosynthesis
VIPATSAPSYPKVTIAVPLYRSAPFLSIVTETLQSQDYPNLEFLISDRHLDDDTIERLQDTFSPDPRFRFLIARDQLDWVAHYNLLLTVASGSYFVWMSHDDSYSSDFVRKLVEALERNPDAILAYARVERITMSGERLTKITPKIPDPSWRPGPVNAYRIALSGGLQFHGVFRRKWLLDRKLWIRPTIHNIAADMLWLFALATIGRTLYVENCTYWKRYHERNTYKTWSSIMRPRYVWSFARVVRSYLADYVPSLFQRVLAICISYLACALWSVRLTLRRNR